METRCSPLPPLWAHVAKQVGRFNPDDPYERCGFLLVHWQANGISLKEVKNNHPQPETRSMITVDQVAAQKAAPGYLWGVLHTHPGRSTKDAVPSADDLQGAAKHPHLVHAMYHPYTRRLVVYGHRGIRYYFRVRPAWISRKGKRCSY